MDDSLLNYWTQQLNALASRGTVLVGGLGLGILANLLAASPQVSKIVVAEISQEVIKLVKPYVHPDVDIVRGDFLQLSKSAFWDTVVYDITSNWDSPAKEQLFRDEVMPWMEECLAVSPTMKIVVSGFGENNVGISDAPVTACGEIWTGDDAP